MDRDLIDMAARALAIEAVYLGSSRVQCQEGFFPQFIEEELALVPQYKSGPGGKMTSLSLNEGATHTGSRVIILNFTVGVRLVDDAALATVAAGEDLPEEAQYLEIEAEFRAQYRLNPAEELEALRPAIEEFGRYNLGYHVWPYWREFVQSTCARLGIPPIPVPMYRLPKQVAADAREDTLAEWDGDADEAAYRDL